MTKGKRIAWILITAVLFSIKIGYENKEVLSFFIPLDYSTRHLTIDEAQQIVVQQYSVDYIVDSEFDSEDSEWTIQFVESSGQEIEIDLNSYTGELIRVDYDE